MIFDALRRHIAQQQPERLREVVDLSIKNRVRPWRLKNAVDEKSKLYNQSHALRSEESQCRYSRVRNNCLIRLASERSAARA
ncbi:MAG: hypothetical protein ACXW6R_07055 [Candidatus Binatia bacterium]